MGVKINEIARILLHFAMFGFSFYALSSLNLGKIMLPGNNSVHFTLAIIASYGLSTSALAPLSSIPS